ncbi:hypothetical protein [Geothermobacter hydrogeniphilus]|uniref:AhpC/TSA family protein n=1 Tax=Geothermobacter hydrogeniphilus TaxID=1969733 RepID=A0A1X0YB97_9BACT|nr:hypothetical protein [Geothermobacter hydrogeniphilus]ORJ62500.1 hypothetical protein B5V00_04230 [Geothermobacter hydrogeniphilus]
MQLQTRLDAMKAEFVSKVDPAILDAMGRAKEQFDVAAMMSGVIQPGNQAPDFTLEDENDNQISSIALREKGPLVMTLYRGVW